MDPIVQTSLMIVGNVLGIVAFFGMIAVFVWLDQRGKTERRKLEHLERMKAIEEGVPLEDGETARAQALGAIGVAVPVSAFSCAGIATGLLLIKPEVALVPLVVLWPVVGVVSLVSTVLAVGPLRRPAPPREPATPRRPAPPRDPAPTPPARPVSGITELRSSE